MRAQTTVAEEERYVPVPYYDIGMDPVLDLDLQPLFDLAREHEVVSGRNGVFGGLRMPDNFFPVERDCDLFLALSYEAARKVFADHDNFSARQGYKHGIVKIFGDVLLGLDRPEHTRSRQLVAQGFTHRNVQAEWLDKYITPMIERRVDSFAKRGRADLVQVLTMHYPMDIISEIIGVPEDSRPEFMKNALAIMMMFEDPEGAVRGARTIDAMTQGLINELRVKPKEGLLLALMETRLEGERLSDDEICRLITFLVPAGMDTTFRSTGNLFYHLFSLNLYSTVIADDELRVAAIEESLRLTPTASGNPRIAVKDVDLAGVRIPAGAGVLACIATANRDGRIFANPDVFDLHRPRRPLMTFGSGIHTCLGANLARLEMKRALEIVGARLRNLRPDPERWPEVKVRGFSLRAVDSLPVVWDPV